MDKPKQNLLLAEQKAKELFNTIEQRGLIVAGKTEKRLCDEYLDVYPKQS